MNERVLRAAGAIAALYAATEPEELSLQKLKDRFRNSMDADPVDTTMKSVLVATALFYAAEHGRNPRVTKLADALEYICTSLSVGYSNIFPTTEFGKVIASIIMTAGPSMAASFLKQPYSDKEDRNRETRTADQLEAILEELRMIRNQNAELPT